MHTPVLLKEAIEYLSLKNGSIVVDATFGEGGHSLEILKRILPQGKLIAIDVDQKAIERGKEKFEKYQKNIIFVNSNFKNIKKILKSLQIEKVDGILADLGFSLRQVKEKEYGLSFLEEMPLDMRLSSKLKISASTIVNRFSQENLERIFKEYGEERFAKKIAQKIFQERKKEKIETTLRLAEIVKSAIPRKFWPKKIHPATKVFQALRIAVNQEFENLKKFLKDAPYLLKENGRLIIISYHSGEDRIVKNAFKELSKEKEFVILTKKPITPQKEEIKSNPRSRSAKMRVLERIKTN